MAKIALFYGSTTGNTLRIAEMIRSGFGIRVLDIFSVDSAGTDDLRRYEILILGTSTWGYGELQDDWAAFESRLDSIDFSGKKVALFGVGDQMSYPDTFVDGMGLLYEKAKEKGATIVGMWPADQYEHSSSKAYIDGNFVGLAIDEDNQPELSEDRVKKWVDQLKGELDL